MNTEELTILKNSHLVSQAIAMGGKIISIAEDTVEIRALPPSIMSEHGVMPRLPRVSMLPSGRFRHDVVRVSGSREPHLPVEVT